MHLHTPTDAEPLRLVYWQEVHFDAIVSPLSVPRCRQNKSETASLEKTRVLHGKKTIVGWLKHKKICDESLLQPADYELFGTRSVCSMSEGGLLAKPIVFTTFDRHWQNLPPFRCLASRTWHSVSTSCFQCFASRRQYRSVPGLTGVVAHKPRWPRFTRMRKVYLQKPLRGHRLQDEARADRRQNGRPSNNERRGQKEERT